MILASENQIIDYTARGWWGHDTLYTLFAERVRRHPERPAIVDPPNRATFTDGAPRRLTWGEIGDKADRLTTWLIKLGFGKDDFLCVQLPTIHEYFSVYLACLRLGIVVSPVPFAYRDHELRYVCSHVEAAGFLTSASIGGFAHAEMALALRREVPSLRHVLAFGDNVPTGAIALDQTLAQPPDPAMNRAAQERAAVTANDIAVILWTSGTEAQPKPVPRSHNNCLGVRTLMTEAANLAEGCRILAPRLMNTTGGITGALLPWLDRGATLALHHPFKLEIFLEQMRDEAVEFSSCPPGILHDLLKRDDLVKERDFPSLRYVSSGSAALPEWVMREFHDRFGVEILNFYGSSEGASLSATTLDLPDAGVRAQFFPRFGDGHHTWRLSSSRSMETKLVDVATGNSIDQTGQPGELCFRGPNVFPGYYRLPDVTQRTFDDEGFYRTGDLFEIAGDDRQYFRFLGRAKDIIVRGGLNISAEEIEGLLSEYPAIQEVAVVGYPDDRLGEKVCAVAVPRAGAKVSLDEIVAYLRDAKKVAVYKLPQRLRLIERLPRSPAGKILKSQVRELARAEPL
jgi:acyl-CoA synthetase (AMP-forming)/AMP-acid ligase II